MSYYYHWVDTSDGGLLVPTDIIFPAVSVSGLTHGLLLKLTAPK